MGCWNETCCFSRLPIVNKDNCVMLVAKSSLTELNFHKRIFDYSSFSTINLFRPVHSLKIYKGLYNEYGWLYDLETTESHNEQNSMFVNIDVWNWLVSKYEGDFLNNIILIEESENSIFSPKLGQIDYREEYIKVVSVVAALRLQPNIWNLKGSQTYDLDLYKEWIDLLNKLVDEKIKHERSW